MSPRPTFRRDPGMFQPLRRDLTLSSRVEQEIERLITDSHLAPGERLLPERDLGERFGVSRTVVREAVRSLAAKGLLEVRTGNGTYVEDRSHASAAEALARLLRLAGVSSPGRTHAIYELRRPLEIAIAELAAMRATPEEVATLKHWVDVIQQPGLDDAGYIEADVRFHVALAEATHNPLFVAVLHSMSSLMNAIREAALAVAGAQQEGRHSHELIYQRVAAHDVSGARRAM
ncbi:MAG TPA: FadR/GntR family transcriptional regulator, partial [Polyangiaceae bacterium]